jgi:hypothetical protein
MTQSGPTIEVANCAKKRTGAAEFFGIFFASFGDLHVFVCALISGNHEYRHMAKAPK